MNLSCLLLEASMDDVVPIDRVGDWRLPDDEFLKTFGEAETKTLGKIGEKPITIFQIKRAEERYADGTADVVLLISSTESTAGAQQIPETSSPNLLACL